MKKIILITTLLFASAIAQAEMAIGIYEVPVDDEQLANSRLFLAENIQFERNDKNIKLKMLVPVDLTGVENVVEFSGRLGHECTEFEPKQISCTMVYQNLKFDNLLAADILAKKFKGTDLLNKLRVQQKFSTDPVGIVHMILD